VSNTVYKLLTQLEKPLLLVGASSFVRKISIPDYLRLTTQSESLSSPAKLKAFSLQSLCEMEEKQASALAFIQDL